MGSLNDMDVESIGSNGEAFFGRGRRENGARWWGNDIKTMLDIAC